MKKSTLIILAAMGLLPGELQAQEQAASLEAPSTAKPSVPPLLLASSLPGMAPLKNPALNLPGMSGPRSLPVPLITDLTNAPNPFDSRKSGLAGQTEISYLLAQDAQVEIQMYDLFGHKVRRWDFSAGSPGGRAGFNSLLWDGTNASGKKVSKGGYIAQLVIETPQTTVTVVRKIGVIH